VRWPGNPRQGDVGALSESFRRFGQQKPVVVQESSRQVAAGNHAIDAMEALRWTHGAGVMSPLSDEDARAYLIADNRTAELGTYDEEALGIMLKKLAQEGNLRGTGYDGDDVDEFLKRMANDEGKVRAEVEFSEELMEEHNYVVLYFDNALDWTSAMSKLGIETVKAPDATDSYDRRGVGRIVRGVDVISRIPG
jgi:ParB-like chromosome segregation protein Spo0J